VSTNVSELQALLGPVYAAPIRASSAEGLSLQLSRALARRGVRHADNSAEHSLLELAAQETGAPSGPLDQQGALHRLLAEDAARVAPQAAAGAAEDRSYDALAATAGRYLTALRSLGLAEIEAPLFLVERFPGLYADLDVWALTCDGYDEAHFSIPRGIYFRRDRLTAHFTRCLIAHELIHLIVGTRPQEYLARGLEEGIADLFQLVLSADEVGAERAETILLNSRIEEPVGQRWQMYNDAARQALLLYLEFGLDGLVALLGRAQRSGRIAMKEAEACCLDGRYEDLGLPRGGWRADLTRFTRTLLGYPVSLYVSPLAYCVAGVVRQGMSEAEVVAALRAEPGAGRAALRELQERCYLLLVRDGRVVADDTKLYLDAGVLRYDVGGGSEGGPSSEPGRE
jgi:hypothetical protein